MVLGPPLRTIGAALTLLALCPPAAAQDRDFDLKRYHQMLVATSGIVRQRMEAGKSRDAVVKEGLPEE